MGYKSCVSNALIVSHDVIVFLLGWKFVLISRPSAYFILSVINFELESEAFTSFVIKANS